MAGELERSRIVEALKLYGAERIRPFTKRKSSIVAVGDSEISGEGVGRYTKGTDGPVNYCHRSAKAAVHRTGISVDRTYNLACSGASTSNINTGGTRQYGEQVQAEQLATKARNTRVKVVAVLIGSNDELNFGAVMADCVTRRMTFQGPCSKKYGPGWQDRVDAMVPKVERTVKNLRTVMKHAGYRSDDYKLVVMSYPSPIGAKGAGRGLGGVASSCMTYAEDGRWAAKTAVPALSAGLRKAARAGGARFLDLGGLFKGHESCTGQPWVRGVSVGGSNKANLVQGSYHPNSAGHAAFARCLRMFYKTSLKDARCTAPGKKAKPVLTAR
jgi:lysophospholipase L1-like esterase